MGRNWDEVVATEPTGFDGARYLTEVGCQLKRMYNVRHMSCFIKETFKILIISA